MIDLSGDFFSPSELGEHTDSATTLCIYRILAQYATENKNTFLLNGGEVSSHVIYSPEMLLPVVALEAMRIWQTLERPANSITDLDITEESLGVTFIESDQSFFPLSAHPPLLTQNIASSMRLLCFSLANRRVFALREGETINLDPLLKEWKHINWYSDMINDIPVPDDFNNGFMRNEFNEIKATQDRQPREKERASPFASRSNKNKDDES